MKTFLVKASWAVICWKSACAAAAGPDPTGDYAGGAAQVQTAAAPQPPRETPREYPAAGDGSVSPDNGGQVPAGASGSAASAASPGEGANQAKSDSGKSATEKVKSSKWARAPVVFWGSLGYEARTNRFAGAPPATSRLLETRLNAKSYIWQPWFALVDGGVGFNEDVSKSGSTSGKGNSVTGEGRLHLFPQSRFPFDGYYIVNDSRTNGDLVSASDYTSTSLGATQSYTAFGSNTTYSASYFRNTLNGSIFGEDVQNAIQANMNSVFDKHHLQVNGGVTTDQHKSTGERSVIENAVAHDIFQPAPTLSFDSQTSFNQSNFTLTTGGIKTRFIQGYSTGSWRPESKPLVVVGNVRTFDSTSETASSQSSARTVAGDLGANYQWNRNTRFTARAGLTYADTNGIRGVSNSESASALYQHDPIPLGRFTYIWSVSGGGGNQSGAGTSSRQFNQTGNHSLTRAFSLAPDSAITMRAEQTLSATQGGRAPGETLQSVLSLTWNRASETKAIYVSASAGDFRSFGAFPTTTEMANLQATINANTSRYASWAGNMTVQATRQNAAPLVTSTATGTAVTSGSGSSSVSASGDLSYIHTRAFDVRNLRFTSTLHTDTLRTDTRFTGTLGAPLDNATKSWENRVDYKIGLLTTSLLGRVAEVAGRRNVLIFFQIRRQFQGVY